MSDELQSYILECVKNGNDWLTNEAVVQYINGHRLGSFAWVILFLGLFIACILYIRWYLKKVRTDDYVDDDVEMIYFLAIIVAAFSIIAVIVNFVFLIQWILYPSGCVLSHIIG